MIGEEGFASASGGTFRVLEENQMIVGNQLPSPTPLVASYWTTAGGVPGLGPGHSRFSFLERVAAAEEAGFTGMGLLDSDLQHILAALSLSECKRILNDHGMVHIELEFLVDWFLTGEKRQVADQRRDFLLEVADVLEPKVLKVGDFSNSPCSLAQVTDSFGELCRKAAPGGTRVAFEPMPVSVIHTLTDALALVRGAGAPNGGLAIDIWHMVSLEIPLVQVSKIAREYLACVELNDAKRNPGSGNGLSDERCYCGQGDLNVRGFVEAIRKTGYSGPWGVELFSQDLADAPVGEVASRAARTAAAFLNKGP